MTITGGSIELRTHLCHIRDPKHETYGVEDVGLARSIETRDGIERRIPSRNLSAYRVRLESCQDISRYIS